MTKAKTPSSSSSQTQTHQNMFLTGGEFTLISKIFLIKWSSHSFYIWLETHLGYLSTSKLKFTLNELIEERAIHIQGSITSPAIRLVFSYKLGQLARSEHVPSSLSSSSPSNRSSDLTQDSSFKPDIKKCRQGPWHRWPSQRRPLCGRTTCWGRLKRKNPSETILNRCGESLDSYSSSNWTLFVLYKTSEW